MNLIYEAFWLTLERALGPVFLSWFPPSKTDQTVQDAASNALSTSEPSRSASLLSERASVVRNIDWHQILVQISQTHPRKIRNGGTDCFFNSFFQVLLNSKELLQAISELPDQVQAEDVIGQVKIQEDQAQNIQAFINCLKNFIGDYFDEGDEPIDIGGLRASFSDALFKEIRNGQQDAGECWNHLSSILPSIHNTEKAFKSVLNPEAHEAPDLIYEDPNPNSIALSLLTENGELIDSIESALNSQRINVPIPNDCNFRSTYKFEKTPPFLILSAARMRTEASIQSTRLEPEYFLTWLFCHIYYFIFGKHYESDVKTSLKTSKITDIVKGPFKELILTQDHLIENMGSQDPRYELIGYTVHIGENIQCGHYISYIKKQDGWYCCNDSQITKLNSLEEGNPGAASMWFYSKKERHPLDDDAKDQSD